MPADPHHPQEVPMFDLVMGQPVPTFSTLADERQGTTYAPREDCDHDPMDPSGRCHWCGFGIVWP